MAALRFPGVRRLIRLEESDSTQTVARRLAGENAPDGTLVWALRQTAGKGRMGRRWRSAPGGLYVSWLIRPSFPPSRLEDFSLACGAAAAAALRDASGVTTAVKPPNDVLALSADGKYRKLCGILCEASGDSSRLHWLVVGIGVNVNNDPPLKRATSVKALTGRSTGLEPVLRALMKRLARARRVGGFA
ncbi:MAG: biotin--[acetyl-CoA-carboxylase] ligase [Elusimicrobia bacterium]|nr:biotin--[acetyl-CoA-carboxylase] ligase [Elusimicrobiota bacterium]MDE2511924.1 biotin--[acetyl-CoA-carboxylase] ligase [Elusimicrobiota bacterium]